MERRTGVPAPIFGEVFCSQLFDVRFRRACV